MLDIDITRDVIAQVVRDQLTSATILSVSVREARDHDDDPILRVTIVFDAPKNRLDPNQAVGLIGLIRQALARNGDHRFPVPTFLTQADAAEIAAGSA